MVAKATADKMMATPMVELVIVSSTTLIRASKKNKVVRPFAQPRHLDLQGIWHLAKENGQVFIAEVLKSLKAPSRTGAP